jgi:hypothetical protein
LKRLAAVLALLVVADSVAAQYTLTHGGNISVDVATDGRLAIDLLETVWILPEDGGAAEAIAAIDTPASRPRWSPNGEAIVYQTRIDGLEQIRQYRFASGLISNIGAVEYLNQQASWHPSGERIVFSSDRQESGFDLWEFDLATGLGWRISHHEGDELEPAWSSDGRDLVYVHHIGGQWSIMLRRFGQPDRALVTSSTALAAPQWRPDGSLITFLRDDEADPSIDMIILSDPLLVRAMVTGEEFIDARVSWQNRQQLLYTANGAIRRRDFNSWSSRNVPFRATVTPPDEVATVAQPARELSSFDVPSGKLIVRTARLFDGIGGGYKNNIDVVIDNGKIAALEPRRERPGEIIVDLGDVTALPGFIDSYAGLPQEFDDTLGALLLSFGVTTIVAEHPAAEDQDRLWSGKDSPGPRIFDAGDEDLIASLLRATDSLADANTPGMDELLRARQASLLPSADPKRRFTEIPDLELKASSMVVASKPNGLPPGMALHAEFLALASAGLDGEQILRAAGVNAAAYLNLGLHVGRLAPGSRADIVLVDGDPLNNAADLRKVVGIVRNGRFFSAIGLIERAQKAPIVE